MSEYYCVVTFHVTQHALIFEKQLKEHELNVKLMPVPRQLSSSCGTAAMVNCEDEKKIHKICIEENIPIDKFHTIPIEKSNKWFLKYFKK